MHCYSFLRADETEDDVRKVCTAAARWGPRFKSHHFASHVHCRCSTPPPYPDSLVRAQQVESTLGGALQGMKMRIVRDVAPNKEMICITFRVPDFCRVSAGRGGGGDGGSGVDSELGGDTRVPKRARADRGASE